MLAGVSIDYYTRLERGNLNGASESVLDALAHALPLDEAERAHLFDLAHAANTTTRGRRRPTQQRIRPACSESSMRSPMHPPMCAMAAATSWQRTSSAMTLYSEMYVDPARPVNIV